MPPWIMSFMTWMKGFSCVEMQEKGLHAPNEGRFACGNAGKSPS